MELLVLLHSRDIFGFLIQWLKQVSVDGDAEVLMHRAYLLDPYDE
jgi:hypothetical protein